MASKLKRVRKALREEILRSVNEGGGHCDSLVQIAGRLMGRDVGYECVLRAFLASEVSNATSQLRKDGLVESIGGKWKPADLLDPDDVEIVSIRRKKRLRGELKSQIRLAHQHGLFEDAVIASQMLNLIGEGESAGAKEVNPHSRHSAGDEQALGAVVQKDLR